jgi:hypothetical protein
MVAHRLINQLKASVLTHPVNEFEETLLNFNNLIFEEHGRPDSGVKNLLQLSKLLLSPYFLPGTMLIVKLEEPDRIPVFKMLYECEVSDNKNY